MCIFETPWMSYNVPVFLAPWFVLYDPIEDKHYHNHQLHSSQVALIRIVLKGLTMSVCVFIRILSIMLVDFFYMMVNPSEVVKIPKTNIFIIHNDS